MRLVTILAILASRLLACTLVDGDRILGRNLAAEHAAFVSLDPAADLGPAPVAGLRRTFLYFELDRIAKGSALALSAESPHEACFERATTKLDSENLTATLRSMLEVPELEILDLSHIALPVGRAEFRKEGLSSSGLWRGKWLYGDNRSMPIWVQVSSPSGIRGIRPASPQRKVARGDAVRVEVRSGGVLLAFDAALESSGHVGEMVTVLNPANGQRFRAVVQGPGKVAIRK